MRLFAWLLLILLTGCDAPSPPQVTFPVSISPAAQQDNWQQCLKQEIQQRVSAAWTAGGVAQAGEVVPASLQKCFPSEFHKDVHNPFLEAYGYVWSEGREYELFANDTFDQVNAPYFSAWDAKNREQQARRDADNKAKLNQEEPAILAAYRDCIFTNAPRLALATDEPAEIVVSATYASCRPNREALVELHRRYDDPSFNEAMMDRIEGRLAPTLILKVIQARAAAQPPPPAQVPPTPNPAPAPEEGRA